MTESPYRVPFHRAAVIARTARKVWKSAGYTDKEIAKANQIGLGPGTGTHPISVPKPGASKEEWHQAEQDRLNTIRNAQGEAK